MRAKNHSRHTLTRKLDNPDLLKYFIPINAIFHSQLDKKTLFLINGYGRPLVTATRGRQYT